jgi:proteasome beta subunit
MEALPGTTVGIKVDGGVVLAAEKRVAYQLYLMSKSGKKSTSYWTKWDLPALD